MKAKGTPHMLRKFSGRVSICSLTMGLLFQSIAWGGWGQPPIGWGDYQFGLVNDGKAPYNERMKAALADGIQLSYRYVYINSGVDPTTNAFSWLFSPWRDYVKDSQSMGLRSAFVIYMMQEDVEGDVAAVLARNAQNPTFMKNFFTTLKLVAEKAAGQKSVFIMEPDTWGYIFQAGVDPLTATALVNNIGGDFTFLSDLPNNYAGLAQGMIRTIKHYAPDAYAGILMSHWVPNAYACPGPDIENSHFGLPWRSVEDIDCAADKNIAFANALLGSGKDRGDFIGVEKNGHSAGYWLALGGKDISEAYLRRYYWSDQQNSNFVRWCKRLGQGVDLPVLGWQISIGHPGLPNTCSPGPVSDTSGLFETGNCAFEDTFFPYFFNNVQSFSDAGVIGFMVGKGLADDVDYTHANKDPEMGDRGWFFQRLKEFDQKRPYLKNVSSSNPGLQAKVSAPKLVPVRRQGGWIVQGIDSRRMPRIIDANGTEVGHVTSVGGQWNIQLNSPLPGIYMLAVPGQEAISLPYF